MLNKAFEQDRSYLAFHTFWAWQYVQRNPQFRKLCELYKLAEQEILPGDADKRIGQFLEGEECLPTSLDKEVMASNAERLPGYLVGRYGFNTQGPFGVEYSSGTILECLIRGEEPERPLETMSLPRLAEVHAFREVEDGKKVLTFGSERIEGRDLLLSVSLDMPIEAVLAEVKDLFKAYRWSDRLDRGLEREEVDYDLKANVSRIRQDKDVAFRSSKENARAIGLWLWDYLDDCSGLHDRGKRAEALRALKERYDMGPLGYFESEDDVLFRWIRQTIKCVERGKVLSVA